MMEGWDLVCSLHIRGNVIGMWGRTELQVGRDWKAEECMECVEQTHKGSGAVGCV